MVLPGCPDNPGRSVLSCIQLRFSRKVNVSLSLSGFKLSGFLLFCFDAGESLFDAVDVYPEAAASLFHGQFIFQNR